MNRIQALRPPETSITARVLPCVGRTVPTFSGIQSICAFMIPVIGKYCSGDVQTKPSAHVTASRSACTLG